MMRMWNTKSFDCWINAVAKNEIWWEKRLDSINFNEVDCWITLLEDNYWNSKVEKMRFVCVFVIALMAKLKVNRCLTFLNIYNLIVNRNDTIDKDQRIL